MRWGPEVRQLMALALKEDIGPGDITTLLLVNSKKRARAAIYAKSAGVLAGIDLASMVFRTVDKKIRFQALLEDGRKVGEGDKVAEIQGRAASILTAERTALNFLQHLSGIATLTSNFVPKTKHTKAVICDTRKTTPGWRVLEKYAVRVGGGKNHRQGLCDQILIKDNHIKVVGSVSKAVCTALAKNKKKLPLEVETANLGQVKQALDCGADWIMLDNMSLAEMRKGIGLIRQFSRQKKKKIVIEVSGKVSLKNVRRMAKTGPDLISVGKLTHSAPALDFSLEILEAE